MSAYLGRAGELAGKAELLRRGINCSTPEVDDGVDVFTLPNGKKIQVKASSLNSRRARYSFPLTSGHRSKKRVKDFSNVDYLLCIGWPKYFYQKICTWIIPVFEVSGMDTLKISVNSKLSRFNKYRGKWSSITGRVEDDEIKCQDCSNYHTKAESCYELNLIKPEQEPMNGGGANAATG